MSKNKSKSKSKSRKHSKRNENQGQTVIKIVFIGMIILGLLMMIGFSFFK